MMGAGCEFIIDAFLISGYYPRFSAFVNTLPGAENRRQPAEAVNTLFLVFVERANRPLVCENRRVLRAAPACRLDSAPPV